MKTPYTLYLFDLDDTLLDFKASERLSFSRTMQSLGIASSPELFERYQLENLALWKEFEQAKLSKDHLKVERFRRLFQAHKIDMDPELASTRYLDALPETVVLIDHAVETCEWLARAGEIGIITNGIHTVQTRRIANSALAPFISFVAVSEDAGFAKPDTRFFDYTVKMAKSFDKASTVIVGDRLEADIQGAHNFGIDSCWFNPDRKERGERVNELIRHAPRFEIAHLTELKALWRTS